MLRVLPTLAVDDPTHSVNRGRQDSKASVLPTDPSDSQLDADANPDWVLLAKICLAGKFSGTLGLHRGSAQASTS